MHSGAMCITLRQLDRPRLPRVSVSNDQLEMAVDDPGRNTAMGSVSSDASRPPLAAVCTWNGAVLLRNHRFNRGETLPSTRPYIHEYLRRAGELQ